VAKGMNDLFYVLMSRVVMVRKKRTRKTTGCRIVMMVRRRRRRRRGREKKERLFLMLYDLGTRVVSRPINIKKKEKIMCYTLCKSSITYGWEGQMKKTKQ